MTVLFLGIDPGAKGACGLIAEDGRFLAAFDLPTDPARLFAKLSVQRSPLTEVHVVLEEPFAFAGQGHNPAEQFRAYGVVQGVLACTGLPVETVRSDFWKREMGITIRIPKAEREAMSEAELRAMKKERSRALARCLWPDAQLSGRSSRVVKESWCEALLLGEWLRRREKGRLLG